MNITQSDLDRFGVAANPKLNTTLDKARAIVEWADKCGVYMGTLAINFTNAAGGPYVMPYIGVNALRGAVIDPAKEYCFVAIEDDESGHNLAVIDALLSFYGPRDVIQRLAAETGEGFDPMESEYLAQAVWDAVAEIAPAKE